MNCSVCKKTIKGQYFVDETENAFCSEKCYKSKLPLCSICKKPMENWIESNGKRYCSENCLSQSWPKCSNCNKPMPEWIESENGNKYCSEECYGTILPLCSICSKRMRNWIESNGKQYCSENCLSQSWPKCANCNKPMPEWIESENGRKFCSEECYEVILPLCDVCGKRMREWTEVDEKKYCGQVCISKTFKFYRLNDIERKMRNLGYETLDVLLIGATGVGKSATVNSFLNQNTAEIGYGVEPKTMMIGNYMLSNHIQIWDSPGFGDGIKADEQHGASIKDKLNTRISGDEQFGFIDMVVIILEAALRDMGTVHKILNNIILPIIKDQNRIIIGLNQADFAMKGKNFDYKNNCPNQELKDYLEDKKRSIINRIRESTGKDLQVVYYSAETGYNVTAFLDGLINNIPAKKRYIG